VTARAHTLFNFRLHLPKPGCADRRRRGRAQVPGDVEFKTKTEQGTEMVTEAVTGGVPFGWAAGDEVYGRSSKLRAACEDAGKGYVFAVPVNFAVTTPAGRKAAVAALARLVPGAAWETRSCGRGCKGHRDYEWTLAASSSPRHWVLIRTLPSVHRWAGAVTASSAGAPRAGTRTAPATPTSTCTAPVRAGRRWRNRSRVVLGDRKRMRNVPESGWRTR
jgi:SRSO17 transposase